MPSRSLLGGQGRDPTQSLSLPPENEDDDHSSSFAVGTHEAVEHRSVEPTRVDSPAARVRTPVPPRPVTKPPPIPREDPEGRLDQVLGNYRVVELLGKGGMGCVYKAEHTKLGREVALKMLRSDYAKRKDAVSRFVQEARTVNRVRHRNIVDVPDILELEDGTTCIVMEFLRGQSLGKWARTGIDLPRALAMLVQICDGLSAAHAVGVVHRDLKPDNVIVVPTPDGAELVKLLDFGVAKLLNREDEDIGFQTAAGSVIGTPAYMSPEQAGGMSVDARSDIYSLGAIMYELFCGQPMFRGRSFGEYVRKHLTEMPVPPRQTEGGAHIDARIEAVILKALEKDPNRRYGSVIEMRDALLQLLGGLETHPPTSMSAIATTSAVNSGIASGVQAPPLPTLPSTPGVPLAQVMQSTSVVGAPLQKSPTTWVWVAGGAVAVGVGIAMAVWFAGKADAPAESTDEFLATAPAAAPTPTAQPAVAIEPPPPVQAPVQQIELRFDSLPSAGVYAAGRSSELCRTPCVFNVDLADGEPTDKRMFVVRAEGYRDAQVEVDLTGDQRAFRVTLEQLVPTSRPVASKPEKSRKKPSVPTKVIAKPDKPDKPSPPVEEPASTKKPGGKIDRSYTRDPFKSDR
jgi:serine/threonine-protein kinase